MKSREEQLTWAKQRALISVDVGHFSDAVAGLRADLDENPLTKGAMSSDRARRGSKRPSTQRSAGVRKRCLSGSRASGNAAHGALSPPPPAAG